MAVVVVRDGVWSICGGGRGRCRYKSGYTCGPLPLFPDVVDIHTTDDKETQSSGCSADHCTSKWPIYITTRHIAIIGNNYGIMII